MNGNKSSHILNTSSNLVGFSFLVLTAIRTAGLEGQGITDELAALAVFIFSLSCFISFLSIKKGDEGRSVQYENIADAAFFIGLLLLVIMSLLVVFGAVQLGVK
jgi:hypothetical protein